jgi:AcrR family transcriptional regulator
MEDTPAPRRYRHGNLPNAMRAAARAILDEAGPEGVGLRETARRVGVSATAAYRHFDSKEDLLASVAAEGFRELAAAMRAAGDDREPLIGVGLAYVEFAMQNRGLFRLMFSSLLADRAKFAALNEAATDAFGFLQQVVTGVEGALHEENPATMAAWGPVHGLSALFIDGLVPENQARSMAEQILARSGPIWAESATSVQ